MTHFSRTCALTLLAFAAFTHTAAAQQEPPKDKTIEVKVGDAKPAAPDADSKEAAWASDHTIRIGGQAIPYKATASTTC